MMHNLGDTGWSETVRLYQTAEKSGFGLSLSDRATHTFGIPTDMFRRWEECAGDRSGQSVPEGLPANDRTET